ncbi:S9 family peptidase [Plebeiibacterium sediminum]|uniref:Proline-specific endopeptidase n=1 Tax=Plebeiibacterium sediminum TaxID=2992112 RepID=A0AAE3M4A4_9BACT|nr:S9 family peptidase [Plebeiobacterium sediminum]MCW3786567.1 S9 family peptidase [Plebeiobacterium sediminum]
MKQSIFQWLILSIIMFSCTNSQKQKQLFPTNLPTPPKAEKKDSLLTIHGNTRVDPYFWMRLTDEQKNASEPDAQTQQVLNYLNAENNYTDSVMKNTTALQSKLFDEIVGRIKKDDESVPYFSNGYWYYTKYEKDNEYPIFCRKKETLDNEEQVILNVNNLAKSHEYYAATGLRISQDNKILAFAEDTVSRRVYTIRFKNLETGEYYTDEIPNTQPGGAWANDNKTFFYTSKNKVSLLSEKIWRHELGSNTDKDVMVYHEKDPSFYIGVYKSKSDKYIIISEGSTLVSDYQILNADDPQGTFKQFTPRGTDHLYSLYHYQNKFYILTNNEATNFRLMETPEDKTDISNWKEVIPHREDVLLKGIDIFSNYLVITERKNALIQLRIINQQTKDEHYLNFEEPVYIAYTTANNDFNTSKLRYVYSSMTTPASTIDYDMDKKTKEIKKVQEVVGGHTPSEYVTERKWATATDGTKIPLSVVYKKTTPLNGTAPLLLYAYGSYGNSIDPWFSSTRLSLLDRGFIYVIAHIRGGQEMGRQWYEDGKMMKKINTFTDYIDCSKFLINENYTSPEHLYAMGGSAGGLLMGAVVNMAPELYNGVIAAVPFVDVVSTMLDETIPLTTNEFDEWGNPKEKEAYDYMMKYSPYDNVKAQNYPNMLVTTGLFDSQVQYWEPAKWVAKLRDLKTDNNILMMHTNMEAGHGGASGRFKRYKETALEYSFIFMLEDISE